MIFMVIWETLLPEIFLKRRRDYFTFIINNDRIIFNTVKRIIQILINNQVC